MTILVDTSVWIDHFRRSNRRLAGLLEEGMVVSHPFVIGELACGNLRRRDEILTLLRDLPGTSIVEHDEALRFVQAWQLHGTGLGWIDVHLLASARLDDVGLWSLDKTVTVTAKRLGLPGN